MASKSARKVEIMSMRTSRKIKISSITVDKCGESQNSACEVNSSHYLHLMDDGNKYQMQQKLEKSSSSPINNNTPGMSNHLEKSRRITRSLADNYKRIPAEMEIQNEQVTPEDKPITKLSEEHTLKKLNKLSSAGQLGSLLAPDLNLTVRKPISKQPESLISPYSEVRKSYRKVHKREIFSIPYRKCHDVFEGRIVFLINKLQSGKHCVKDFQSLIEKMQKISIKDMMNKYIISGIRTIVNLCKSCQFADSTMIEATDKLEQEENSLKEKIVQQLENTIFYDNNIAAQAEQFINCSQYKPQIIRKMYKIYKKKYSQKSKKEIREITLRQCQKLFDLSTTATKLIAILKNQMKLPLSK